MCELNHVLELQLVSHRPPLRVVQVLLSPGYVVSDCLDVPVGVGADPYVVPGRRDCQGADAYERLGVVESVAEGVEVLKALAAADARDTGPGLVRPSQARHVELLGGIGTGSFMAPRGYP